MDGAQTGRARGTEQTSKKFDPAEKKHFIAYDDGTEESIDFGEEKVEAVVDGTDGD